MNRVRTAFLGIHLPFSTKRRTTVGVTALGVLADALAGCSYGPQLLAPVEDHSTRMPAQASAPSSPPPFRGSSETTSPARTAPLPSLLEEAPLRAAPLPPPTVPLSPPTPTPTPIAGNSLGTVPPPAVRNNAPGNTTLSPTAVVPSRYPSTAQTPGAPTGRTPSSAVAMLPVPATQPPTATPSPPPSPPPPQPTIQLPAATNHLAASSNGGVVALLGKADDQTAAGQIDDAAATLERALRIEPENGRLWHELASVRLRQGNLDAAVSIAQKSNSFARNQRDLQARNWRLIAVARQKQGQSQAAAEALVHARALEGIP